MKIIKNFVVLAIFSTSFSPCFADISKIFTPFPGVRAVVEIKGSTLVWRLFDGNKVKQRVLNLDTEKTLNLEIGSYDFSGRLGFLVSHIDDGMGVYEVVRVFTFSQSVDDFIERFPSCGDEFFNLKVDRKRRYLVSNYWDKNVAKICNTRLLISR